VVFVCLGSGPSFYLFFTNTSGMSLMSLTTLIQGGLRPCNWSFLLLNTMMHNTPAYSRKTN
jgi:hypothetical protein